MLWIAFKNYYLRDTTQLSRKTWWLFLRCELLSKIIIFVTRHNFTFVKPLSQYVVNCFQKLLSSWHDTTQNSAKKMAIQLWIAFKNYYLRDTTQQNQQRTIGRSRCELLSKIIIFVTRHNLRPFCVILQVVVNCFQKLLSSWHDTTKEHSFGFVATLWIAFKNYYLRDTTQLTQKKKLVKICCELLSKIIIFVTRHNTSAATATCQWVVNCFQKLLSSWHDTTFVPSVSSRERLWIAFKNYYLRDTTQQRKLISNILTCCELLSKIIIFVTRHNRNRFICFCNGVVNCFQKLLSSWHDTTERSGVTVKGLLWIAFKNYYLRDTTQLVDNPVVVNNRCELLSKIIIFVTRHNIDYGLNGVTTVVNCFQKLLSSWHDTTK